MKSVGDLTEMEALKLNLAQTRLREMAFSFAVHPYSDKGETLLFIAARRFDAVVREIGMDDYFKEYPSVYPARDIKFSQSDAFTKTP